MFLQNFEFWTLFTYSEIGKPISSVLLSLWAGTAQFLGRPIFFFLFLLFFFFFLFSSVLTFLAGPKPGRGPFLLPPPVGPDPAGPLHPLPIHLLHRARHARTRGRPATHAGDNPPASGDMRTDCSSTSRTHRSPLLPQLDTTARPPATMADRRRRRTNTGHSRPLLAKPTRAWDLAKHGKAHQQDG